MSRIPLRAGPSGPRADDPINLGSVGDTIMVRAVEVANLVISNVWQPIPVGASLASALGPSFDSPAAGQIRVVQPDVCAKFEAEVSLGVAAIPEGSNTVLAELAFSVNGADPDAEASECGADLAWLQGQGPEVLTMLVHGTIGLLRPCTLNDILTAWIRVPANLNASSLVFATLRLAALRVTTP